jgi:hypothetical protein
MTTPFHRKNRCFMQDFAARDARSAHAHLRGQSWRARAYVAFEAMSRLFGRRKHAADDYRQLSRWLYRRHEPLARCAALIGTVGTALAGMAAGMALYLAIQP